VKSLASAPLICTPVTVTAIEPSLVTGSQETALVSETVSEPKGSSAGVDSEAALKTHAAPSFPLSS
jgi:hypothetical protein